MTKQFWLWGLTIVLLSNLATAQTCESKISYHAPAIDPVHMENMRYQTLPAPTSLLRSTPDTEWSFHKSGDSSHPSGAEQAMVWLMNRARANPPQEGEWLATTDIANIAGARNYFGVDVDLLQTEFDSYAAKAPAAFDVRLYNAAKVHCEDLIARDAQDHQNQFQRITDAGFYYSSARGNVFSYAEDAYFAHAGYNIDWGEDIPPDDDGMQKGRGHRLAIMAIDGNYTNVGIAMVPESNPDTNVGPIVTTGNYCEAYSTTDHYNRFIVGTVWQDANGNDMYDEGEGIANVKVMPDSGTYYAIVADSGGYAIPITASGQYTVTFSGAVNAIRTVNVGSESVLLDLYDLISPLAIDFGSSMGLFTYSANNVTRQQTFSEWTTAREVTMALTSLQNSSNFPAFSPHEEFPSVAGNELPPFSPQDSIKMAQINRSSGYTQINSSDPLHSTFVDFDGDKEPELVASYQGQGIYIHYRDGSTTWLHSVVPDYFAAVDLDGDGKEELAITFAQFGFYIYKKPETSWTRIHSVVPTYFAAVDWDNDGKEELGINFPQFGFYTYEDGNVWNKHHSILPTYFCRLDFNGDGNEYLAIAFQQFGLYLYDGNNWSKLHSLLPQHFCAVDTDNDGKDELAVSFDYPTVRGLFTYATGGIWLQLHSLLPSIFVNCDVNSNGKQELAVVFDGSGLHLYESDGGWSLLHSGIAESLASWIR